MEEGYGWPKQFSLKQNRAATNLCLPFTLSCAGRLWRSLKGWFVSSLTARFLAGVACTEFAVIHSFQSKKTAEEEAHISHSAFSSLCCSSPVGVKCWARAQACASCKAGPESGRRMWHVGGAGCPWEDTGGLCSRNLLLWEKTKRPVPLDVFMLGELRRNNSAVNSRQSSTRMRLGNV